MTQPNARAVAVVQPLAESTFGNLWSRWLLAGAREQPRAKAQPEPESTP
jgi:hypothetical protein